MNELYTQTELIRGRWYRYDPDRDIWYPVESETAISAWAWVIVVAILAALAYYVEYLR